MTNLHYNVKTNMAAIVNKAYYLGRFYRLWGTFLLEEQLKCVPKVRMIRKMTWKALQGYHPGK